MRKEKSVGKGNQVHFWKNPALYQKDPTILQYPNYVKLHWKSVKIVLVVWWLRHMSSDFMKLAVTAKYKILWYE